MKASLILKIKIFLQTVQGETDEEKLLAFLVFVLEAAPMVTVTMLSSSCHSCHPPGLSVDLQPLALAHALPHHRHRVVQHGHQRSSQVNIKHKNIISSQLYYPFISPN